MDIGGSSPLVVVVVFMPTRCASAAAQVGSRQFPFVAAAYERRSLGISSHWPFESWGRFLPEHTTAVSMLDRLLHHCHTVVTDGDSSLMRQARATGGARLKNSWTSARGGDSQ